MIGRVVVALTFVGLVAASATLSPTQQNENQQVTSLAQQKEATSPAIAKVVTLIEELMSKVEADGKAEQKLYDKFACWCEKTTARKGAAIEEAKAKIEELTQLINELAGKRGTLGAEVAQLKKDVASTEEAIKEATSLREKEQEEYLQERSDSEQCIGALEHAIKVLTGAGEGRKDASALQYSELISAAAGIRTALRKVPQDSMNEADLAVMKSFVEDPKAFWSQKEAGGFIGAQVSSQNPFGDYAPASGQIQGILKGMYDEFTSSLEESNAEEATKQKDFEELIATKTAELESLKSTLGMKDSNHADSEKRAADAKVEREATQKQLEEDEKFFEEMKAACKAKALAWAERSRLRTEELAGMQKAVEILTSEEASATFQKSHETFFLQLGNNVENHEDTSALAKAKRARRKVFESLKAMATKSHSLRLASLAAMVRTAEIPDGGAMDAFAPVIEAIDKMIAELRVEEQEDIEHRDWCENKENKLNNQKDDLDYKIGQSEGLIERLEAVEEQIDKDIESTEADILETEEAMAEALATRNEETEEFRAALKEDADAAALIAGAIEALTAFYTNNKLPLALLGKKAPEYSTDPDVAPETGDIDKGYGGASSESKGIISILEMLKEDLENEMKEAKADEEAAAAEYAEQRKTAQEGLDALNGKKGDLESQKADTQGKINDANEDISNHNDQKDAKEEELKAMDPNCNWLKKAFETRRDARKKEIEGLIQAKAVLQGAGEGSMLVQANKHGFLVQKKK